MIIFLAICAFSAFPGSVICHGGAESRRRPSSSNSHPNLPVGAPTDPEYDPVYPNGRNGPKVEPIIESVGVMDGLFCYNHKLFFKDSSQYGLCAYNEADQQISCTLIGDTHIAFVLPDALNSENFLMSFNNQILLVKWNRATGSQIEIVRIFHEIRIPPGETINYGAGEPAGGFFFGTVRPGLPVRGRLWSFHPRLPPTQFKGMPLPGIAVTNSIVFDINDHSRIYCIDALHNRIVKYAYDAENREIMSKPVVVFDLERWFLAQRSPPYNGHAMLSRMTIDNRGRLYVCLLGGSHVLQLNLRSRDVVPYPIRIPAVKVSECVFGGTDMKTLYVSTLAFGTNEEAPAGDMGGKIFKVTGLDSTVQGIAAWPFVMPSLYA